MSLRAYVSGPENGLGGTFRGTFTRFCPPDQGFRSPRYALKRVAAPWCGLLRAVRSHLFCMGDDEPQIMTGEQVAQLLQVSPRTVEEWRQSRSGPPFRRMGKHVRYLRREVLAWFEGLAQDA